MRQRIRQGRNVGRAPQPIQITETEQQQGGGEHTEKEVFQGGFLSRRIDSK